METVKTKEKVLLWVNKADLENTKKLAKNAEKDLNRFVSRVEKEMKQELNREQRLILITDAPLFLEKNLKFNLPDAPQKLKYEAIGFDLDGVMALWNVRNWNKFEFNQDKDGNFELAEHQPAYEKHKRYATDRQLVVVKQAGELAGELNYALDRSLHNAPPYKVCEIFKVLKVKENRFEPNLEYIAHRIDVDSFGRVKAS